MLSSNDLSILTEKIVNKIQANFEEIHLSKNLVNTIEVRRTTFGFEIDIPAEIYDIGKWKKEKVIVYTNQGSYAQQVDVDGGFSGQHINYVENAIQEAISEWASETKQELKGVNYL